MSVLVAGARGQVGSGVLAGLLAAEVEVRAAGREPTRMPDRGAPRVRLDLADPSSFGPVLRGVERVFAYVSDDLRPFADAARDAGVKHVVLLSSNSVLLDPAPELGGLAADHAAAEAALRSAGLPTTALRPGAFCGNTRMWSRGIAAGVVELAHPEVATAPIDERDIADVAVAALLGPVVDESVHLTGPASLTLREQVGLVADVLAREIEVRSIDPVVARRQMQAHAPSEHVDSLHRYWAQTDGVPATVTDEVVRRSGHPPRTFQAWLQEVFAPGR